MDDEAPPPRKPRFWIGRRCALAMYVLFPVMLFGAVFGTLVLFVWVFVPLDRSGLQPRTRCANHLRQIGSIIVSEATAGGAYPTEGGAPLLIRYRRRLIIRRTREEVLMCPDDPDVRVPQSPAGSAIYDSVDMSDPAALAPLCSYAVRNFARYPVNPDGTDPETGDVAWVACDRQGRDGRTPHHESGLNVLFADGAVQFRDRASLGIAPGDPIIVGPGSPHTELRKLIFIARD